MHIEFLVEDSSGERLLGKLLPKILGPINYDHSWRIKSYKGVGHLPTGLKPKTDAAKRILLDRLPDLIRAYNRTPGIDSIVVVVDSDRRDCAEFLRDLKAVAAACGSAKPVMVRLAIEEMEAWYFGDRTALLASFPKAKPAVLGRYVQDSVCGTWEMLADAVHPGGVAAIKKAGFPASGYLKHEWAETIGARMDPERNESPSFRKLRDGLRRLVEPPLADIEGPGSHAR